MFENNRIFPKIRQCCRMFYNAKEPFQKVREFSKRLQNVIEASISFENVLKGYAESIFP